MKIVVVYATAGAGHKKAAQAIEAYLRVREPGADIALVDVISQASSIFRFFYLWGYDFLINHCQWLWAAVFYASSRPAFRALFNTLTSGIQYYNTRSFASYLVDMQPDVVVSTHFLSSDIVSFLKGRGQVRARLITIITDFGVHPLWLAPYTDFYCVASDATRDILTGDGVPAAKIRVTGIPIDTKFTRLHDRKKIQERLGIDAQRPAVLVVTGSFGIGPIEEIVQKLCNEYVLLAVCARNKHLYDRLQDRAYPHTHVFGFVDNIDDLMAAADVIITKPGGLTISELLYMDLIPLFIAPIPGQESMNVEILHQAGIGSSIAGLRGIGPQVAQCIKDAPRIKESIRTFKQTNAVSGIYDVIRTDSSGAAR
ncbi:MAG: glycosyltransferase [Candidatus Omnitrophota bacterium]